MHEDMNLHTLSAEEFHRFFPSPDAQRIVDIARNDRVSTQRFSEVIGANPLLAARLLCLTNFVPALPRRFSTLSEAVSIFGQDHLKSLALGLALFALPADPAGKSEGRADPALIRLDQLWDHALGCAIVAGRIAEKIPNVAPLRAFIAGFLHDVGRVLLFQRAREKLHRAVALAADKKIPLSQAEQLTLGTDHMEIGALWCRRTELPAPLQRHAIEHHRTMDPPISDQSEENRITAVVQAADSLCELRGIGRGGDRANLPDDFWRRTGLEEIDWLTSLQTIKNEVEAAREIFGFGSEAAKEPQRQMIDGSEGAGIGRSRRVAVNAARGQVVPFPIRVAAPPASGAGRAAATKLKILVVEDHNSLCDMLSLYLMRYGYHVRTASDGESALDILAKEEIHLILLDLMLPRMDGFAVLRTLRERQKDKFPYIVVVSAGASEKDRSKVLDLGANEYMAKPFHLARLLERIQSVEKYLL